ncbi:MAG: hypothetical protein LBN20_01500, partial [Endomicrobium sp.]|nr:hypothetical protein [Endomicrobium sp.]
MQNIDIQSIKPAVDIYLNFMKSHPNGEEIQYRAPLENLFNKIKFPHQNASILQEDRHSGIEVDGMPDFFVYKDEDTLFKSLVGFIECKKPSYILENLINSEQIKKYQKTCENIIITNYKEFILLQNGGQIGAKIALNDSGAITLQNFVNLLQEFYSYDYQWIKTKKSLTAALANQSFYYSTALREFIADKANEENVFYTKFNGLFNEYQKSISYHYELPDFCDIYAQSLVYGLMLVRLADSSKKLDEKSLEYLNGIPKDYKLLYEFLSQGYANRDLPIKIKIALVNIGKNINLIDTESIQKEFLDTGEGKSNIAVYLYEDFLSQYDKLRSTEKRKEGGVYYTPNEAADFITRGVGDIIKQKFKLKDGYLSDNVKILDFASGTGTFLRSIFEMILPKNADDLTKSKAKEKIIKDIYGFELLFTPYIVSHTILTRFLKERGINLGDDRLGIYLTNTLDIEQHSISEFLPRLKQESDKAAKIKNEEDILAIVGNPPYFNGKSQSVKGRIDEYLQDYKRGLNEKKINLDDSYIKFIRFAEWKIEKAGYGIVGIITNNSYLDGITHRKMRQHLSEIFDEIYIVNLHGNSRKGESDKNIFDIMVGVSIVFFIKTKSKLQEIVGANNHSPAVVSYFSTLDNKIITRNEKLDFLKNAKISNIKWKELQPKSSNFYFVDKDFSGITKYEKFWKINEVFGNYNSGIQTKNDDFVLKYNRKKLAD